jgi:hypothetical protein
MLLRLMNEVSETSETFIPERVAAKRASLLLPTLHRWLTKRRTPNGWSLTVKQGDSPTQLLVAEESVQKLENRFIYVSSGKPAGPRSFSPHPPLRPRSHYSNDDGRLFPFDEAVRSFEKQFGEAGRDTFRQWCAEERGPGKTRIRLVRDSITNRIYVGQGNLSAAQAALRIQPDR